MNSRLPGVVREGSTRSARATSRTAAREALTLDGEEDSESPCNGVSSCSFSKPLHRQPLTYQFRALHWICWLLQPNLREAMTLDQVSEHRLLACRGGPDDSDKHAARE